MIIKIEIRHLDGVHTIDIFVIVSFSFTADKVDSFNTGRNRIRAAFNVLGIKFQEDADKTISGKVDYKLKNIRHQNRQLNLGMVSKKPRHVYFDDDGNSEECTEVSFH